MQRAWASLITVCLACTAQEHLVRNPGFEDGRDAPAEWQFNQRGTTSQITWDRSVCHGGNASVRITNRDRDETGNVTQSYRFDRPLSPGSILRFSAYVRTQKSNGAPRIVMQLYSTGGHRQNGVASGGPGSREFTLVEGMMVASQPSDRLGLYLCNYSMGSVWWDDVTVTAQRAEPADVVARPASPGPVHWLRTEDDLELALNDTGGVTSVCLGESDLTVADRHSGLWVQPFGGDILPVSGEILPVDGTIRQEWRGSDLDVRVVYSVEGQRLICEGVVRDTTGKPRGVELWFALPAGATDWEWGHSIRRESPVLLGDQDWGTDVTTFACVSHPQTGDGIALAVPPEAPCDFRFAHNPQFGFSVRFRLGLSPRATGPLRSAAPFRFVIYRCDGTWGFRDAARRYYAFFPEAFVKRATHEGLWLFGRPPPWLPDPEHYAFHEGGPAGWEYDDRYGIATFPYIIPGQREITRLEELPSSTAAALRLLDLPTASDETRSRGWGKSKPTVIRNCLLLDRDQAPHVVIRHTPWGGNSATFPLNADPSLFADQGKTTIASILLDWVSAQCREVPSLDGIYVDSLGLWGDFVNHRHDHFAYAQIPLTVDSVTGLPAMSNQYALLEFLWALRDRLHESDRLLFANGVHQTRPFHFFALDVLGVEGKTWLDQKRVMAYRKPFLLLIYNMHDKPEKMAHSFNLCTFYGIYPSFGNMRVFRTPEMYAPVESLNRRFVPALRQITKAGWQPITHARTTSPHIWLERWGRVVEDGLYLTVYNASENDTDAEISLPNAPLGLNQPTVQLTDLLDGEAVTARKARGRHRFVLPVPSQTVRVMRVLPK